MSRDKTTTYYFKRRPDLQGFEYRSTDCRAMLSDYIGEFLALAMCDGDNDLEMVRFRRYGVGETVIAHKLLDHIKLSIIVPVKA